MLLDKSPAVRPKQKEAFCLTAGFSVHVLLGCGCMGSLGRVGLFVKQIGAQAFRTLQALLY
ncbi:MAG: hypothetical protein MR446_08980, partial [Bacteroidales bacterium]|nr:hypothetical protein [Bacteroidales bacterium]